MSIRQNKLVNSAELGSSITSDSIKNTIELNGTDSAATYTVVIKNLGQVDYQLKSINEKLFSNSQVEYVLDGFYVGGCYKIKGICNF